MPKLLKRDMNSYVDFINEALQSDEYSFHEKSYLRVLRRNLKKESKNRTEVDLRTRDEKWAAYRDAVDSSLGMLTGIGTITDSPLR
jgi:hypothetical protein